MNEIFKVKSFMPDLRLKNPEVHVAYNALLADYWFAVQECDARMIPKE